MDDFYEQKLIEEHEREMMNEFEQRDVFPLMPILESGLIHRTGIAGFRGIQTDGFIKPNVGGLPYTYSHSEGGFGKATDCVCLFDFESTSREKYLPIYTTWTQFFYDQVPATIVLKLSRDFLQEKLIQNSTPSNNSFDDNTFHIPFVEVWYPEPIPVSAIDSYLLVVQNFSTHSSTIQFEEFGKDEVEKLNEAVIRLKSCPG